LSNSISGVGILGIGSCLPEKVLTNYDLEKMVDTSDEWITKRTGISERRILDDDTPTYGLGVTAARKALEDAGLTAEQIDLIIVTTEVPDYLTPSTACIIQREIGAVNAAAFDMNAACSGFAYALTISRQFIETGFYKHILIVCCEGLSKVTDWKDRNTCILFGDGAGAAVIGKVEKDYGILSTYIGADGNLGHNITVPCCFISDTDREKRLNGTERTLWMDGAEVFKFAVKIMEEASLKALELAGMTLDDIKMIVPHQANIRIVDGAAKRLKVPSEKIYTNLQKYGNISSASIVVALDELIKSGAVRKGDNLVLVGFGGGLTWGSAVLKWNK